MTINGTHRGDENEHAARLRALRCAADGEPAPEPRPEDAPRVAFERSLRRAVSRVMSEPAHAPASLRDRVVLALRDAAPDTRSRVLTWPLAVAATVLVALTLFFAAQRAGVLGPESDQAYEVRVATFIDEQHNGCADCVKTFARKMKTTALDQATDLVLSAIGAVPTLGLDLSSLGYDFVGVGKCGVPGSGKSVHLMYRNAASGEPMSVFVKQYTGARVMEEGSQRLLTCKKLGTTPILCWRSGPLILYVKSPSDTARDAVGEALGAPGQF